MFGTPPPPHAQVNSTYGDLPSFSLLLQYGFLPPAASAAPAPGDITFVRLDALLEAAAGGGALHAALEREATRGALHRDRFGKIAQLQPAGAALEGAVGAIAAQRLLPDALLRDDAKDGGAEGAGDGAAAYSALLRRTLDAFSTSIGDDARALRIGGDTLPPRHRLALEFRLLQKRALRALLDERGAVGAT